MKLRVLDSDFSLLRSCTKLFCRNCNVELGPPGEGGTGSRISNWSGRTIRFPMGRRCAVRHSGKNFSLFSSHRRPQRRGAFFFRNESKRALVEFNELFGREVKPLGPFRLFPFSDLAYVHGEAPALRGEVRLAPLFAGCWCAPPMPMRCPEFICGPVFWRQQAGRWSSLEASTDAHALQPTRPRTG